MIVAKKNKRIYFIALLSLAVFLVLKVQRGFTASEEQGGLWNIIQLLYVCMGLYSCLTLKKRYLQFSMIKSYLAFMFLVWFMSFFVIWSRSNFDIGTLFHFMTIPYGALCFVFFYDVGLKNDIRKYSYILYFTFIVITCILFSAQRTYYSLVLEDKGAIADVYYIVGLLPIIFIYTPRKLRILPFLLACIAVMMTGKRTGFLALATIFILYFLFNDPNERKSFIYRLLFFAIFIITSYLVIIELTESFDLNMFDRLENLSEDGGSGRAERWKQIWDAFAVDNSILALLVGHGCDSVVELVGGHAHNDFLEFFYNYGIIVFGLYITLFVSMIRECIKMYKAKFIYAREFMVAIVISLFLAMFSFYAIDCTYITCCSVCLGLILAEWFKYKNEIKYE